MFSFFFFQFLLIYRKARAGELIEESGLSQLAALTEIDVEEVGVGGAKTFFEAKVCVKFHLFSWVAISCKLINNAQNIT